LVLLQELEEVLNFDAAVLGHVRAVHHVSDSVLAEFSPGTRNSVTQKQLNLLT